MAEASQDGDKPPRLSERVETYRKEVQSLVKQGGEQPQFEFKRTVCLGREKLGDRLDFVKFLQGLANAEVLGERCIAIGADPKEKKFHPVINAAEFDSANLAQLLAAYLDPLPHFEVFHLTTDQGDPFVLIVLDANQPRPIVVAKQGHTQDGKIRLEVGDIWIKRNTNLARATRADLGLMYESKIEKEAEDRARKRVKHLLELSSTPQAPQVSALRVPEFSLLVGPKNDLKSFTKELIAAGDLRRFQMLLELAREPLVDGWDHARASQAPPDITQFTSQLVSFFRDEFFPSFQSVVELGLLAIKYEADEAWFAAVIDVLLDALEASRGLNWLKSAYMLQQSDAVPWWKPAFDIYIGLRVTATYSVVRNRLKFLGSVLPRTVVPITIDDRPMDKTPILFWPFRDLSLPPDWYNAGRATFLWKERIAAAWGEYFGTAAKFTNSSAQLELLLEFNSYVGTNTLKNAKLKDWLGLNSSDTSFAYAPDLYSQDLRTTVPMAERLYDILSAPDPRFPPYLAVDVRIFNRLFADTQPHQRLEIYAGFLQHVKAWQAKTMFEEFRRFPFMFTWGGRLKKIVDDYTAHQKKTTS